LLFECPPSLPFFSFFLLISFPFIFPSLSHPSLTILSVLIL
jgi:hypothetical protein